MDRMAVHQDINESIYNRLEFVGTQPELAVPLLLILGLAAVAGTFGNILILISVATRKSLHNVESIFIVNLACSDLYVTFIATPMSIVAKVEGIQFFDQVPGLCRAIGSLCTISCVTSLLTIAAMSCNRYTFIVHNHLYRMIFKQRNCVIMCAGFYCVGLTLVLLNLADVGGHEFDHKSLECIWDRMATYDYTIVFSVVMVWVPIIVVGASYLHMYMFVRAARRRVHNAGRNNGGKTTGPPSIKLAKTLFIIYMVFSLCWIPYAILVVSDTGNSFRRETHIIIVVWAHMHPSINWLVFYFTNRKFNEAFNAILHINTCCPDRVKAKMPAPSCTNMPDEGGKTRIGKTEMSTISETVAPSVPA